MNIHEQRRTHQKPGRFIGPDKLNIVRHLEHIQAATNVSLRKLLECRTYVAMGSSFRVWWLRKCNVQAWVKQPCLDKGRGWTCAAAGWCSISTGLKKKKQMGWMALCGFKNGPPSYIYPTKGAKHERFLIPQAATHWKTTMCPPSDSQHQCAFHLLYYINLPPPTWSTLLKAWPLSLAMARFKAFCHIIYRWRSFFTPPFSDTTLMELSHYPLLGILFAFVSITDRFSQIFNFFFF